MYQDYDLPRPSADLLEPITDDTGDGAVFCYSATADSWFFGSVRYDRDSTTYYCDGWDGKVSGITHFMRAPIVDREKLAGTKAETKIYFSTELPENDSVEAYEKLNFKQLGEEK